MTNPMCYFVKKSGESVNTSYTAFKNHMTLEEAKAEAERLAKKEDDKFDVYQIHWVGSVAPVATPLKWTMASE